MTRAELNEKNLKLFYEKLEKLGIKTSVLGSNYNDKLLNATFTHSNEFGNAYDGSLLGAES